MSAFVQFPYRIDSRQRTACADEADHIRDLIEQILFTAQGERVNRPDFGGGLQQMVFGASSETMATTAHCLVQGALQQWLGDRVAVESVRVESRDNRLTVTVQYTLVRDRQRQVARFEQAAAT